jgi:hypothetical protein
MPKRREPQRGAVIENSPVGSVANINATKEPRMTDDMMHLQTLVVKTSDADMLRTMIGYAARRRPRRALGGRDRSAQQLSYTQNSHF